jgi:prophage maintenance system killer protein
MNPTENQGQVVIYQTSDGMTSLEVHLERDTVWLNQAQMVELFQRNQSVISRHVRNVFKEGELEEKGNMQKMHIPNSDKPVTYFNLDVVISIGYRVKSPRGTQFRIWATHTLKDHLIHGYTLNERRLREKGLNEARESIKLLAQTLERHSLIDEQGKGVLNIITRYARSWTILQRFDENLLELPAKRHIVKRVIAYETAKPNIELLKDRLIQKGEASSLFGQEQNLRLKGILGSIEQTFDGQELYPSVEEKAANLIYFIIKDHPFVDGNKRIGSFLFTLFLRENGCLEDINGNTKIDENTLVALALLIAESEPSQKDLMIKLIMNLLDEQG